jgi:hypothetical protein
MARDGPDADPAECRPARTYEPPGEPTSATAVPCRQPPPELDARTADSSYHGLVAAGTSETRRINPSTLRSRRLLALRHARHRGRRQRSDGRKPRCREIEPPQRPTRAGQGHREFAARVGVPISRIPGGTGVVAPRSVTRAGTSPGRTDRARRLGRTRGLQAGTRSRLGVGAVVEVYGAKFRSGAAPWRPAPGDRDPWPATAPGRRSRRASGTRPGTSCPRTGSWGVLRSGPRSLGERGARAA